MSELNPFNIMAKPVCGLCNLDCSYCYYTHKTRELYPDVDRYMMSDEVLESYVRQYCEAMPIQADFGWQGGEPMLAGLDFYRKVVELQEKYKQPDQVINNSFQTNGTLLDQEWCSFLARHNFLVGLSLDGPPQWHDSFRRDHAGNPSFHRAWAGLELMRKHGVEFNVLVTLNSVNAPHAGDIYRYFVNRGVEYLQFIPILERDDEGNPTDFSCRPEQFGQFMLDVFNIWADRDVGHVSERLIDSVLHTMVRGQAAMCCYARRCANAHVLEFNGDLYACDHFVQKQWKVGNITRTPLAQLVRSPMIESFAVLKTDLPDKCRACEFLRFCNAGCPKHHVPIGTDPQRVNYFCGGLEAFFTEALPVLAEMAEYFKRGQTPPSRKAHEGSTLEQPAMPAAPPIGRAPGRNDPCPCGSGKKFKVCCGR